MTLERWDDDRLDRFANAVSLFTNETRLTIQALAEGIDRLTQSQQTLTQYSVNYSTWKFMKNPAMEPTVQRSSKLA